MQRVRRVAQSSSAASRTTRLFIVRVGVLVVLTSWWPASHDDRRLPCGLAEGDVVGWPEAIARSTVPGPAAAVSATAAVEVRCCGEERGERLVNKFSEFPNCIDILAVLCIIRD